MLVVFVLSGFYIFANLEVVKYLMVFLFIYFFIFLAKEIEHTFKVLFGHSYFLFYETSIIFFLINILLIFEILYILST